MYKPGDDKLEVRELLVKAFASAWEAGDKAVDLAEFYIVSDVELTQGEELSVAIEAAEGAWVYYAVPAENYFILTWMEDAEKAAAKVNSLKDEDDSLACIVDLTQEWTRAAE